MAIPHTTRTTNLYLDLIHRFPLRHLRSDDELDAASTVVDELLTRPALATEEREYLDVLSDLIHRYEDQKYPFPTSSVAGRLRYLMECRSLSQTRVAEETAMSVSTISEVLSGKRTLSRNNIIRLARFFAVSADYFIE